MIIEKVTVGTLEENCYIVGDAEELIVIDPGADALRILNAVKNISGTVKYVFITHCHYDHIGAVGEIVENTGAKLIVAKSEKENYLDDKVNLKRFFGSGKKRVLPDILVKEGDIINSGKNEFKVIETPGHTSGSICLICNKTLFSGDTLFERSVGRTDFPTGSFDMLLDSVKNKLFKLDDNTVVYPGHGEMTTIGAEKRDNDLI